VKDTAERNPFGLTVGAAAVGFVAGLLIPSTRVENERMGEMPRLRCGRGEGDGK
jgi:hypothetical protein